MPTTATVKHPTYGTTFNIGDGRYPDFDESQHCFGVPTEMFYFDEESYAESWVERNRYDLAKRPTSPERRRPVFQGDRQIENSTLATICEGCPFLAECFSYALHNEEFGFWAGTTPAQREVIRSRKRIRKSRKVYEFDDREVLRVLDAMRKQKEEEAND